MEKGKIDLDALFHLNYGMYIVSSTKADTVNGCVVNTTGYIEAQDINKIDVGSHTLFIGKVVACEQFGNGKIDMTYNYYRDVRGGRTPRTAATYQVKNL